MAENQKMTLKGYYDSLSSTPPNRAFIERVARRCGVTDSAVRNWIFYGVKPKWYRYIKILVEETGINEDALWED